jgi:hypothetical protein
MKRRSWRQAAARICSSWDVEGGGFLAEDVLAGGEGLDAKIGVGVRVGGDVDCIDVGGEELV